jgi:hypothetical protein
MTSYQIKIFKKYPHANTQLLHEYLYMDSMNYRASLFHKKKNEFSSISPETNNKQLIEI